MYTRKTILIALLFIGCANDNDMSFLTKFSGNLGGGELVSQIEYFNRDSPTHKIYFGEVPIPSGNVINITSDGTSYDQLRTIINGLSGVTALNPYKVNITGTFKETDLQARDYVWLNGTDSNAIVETNGEWDIAVPSDYSFPTESNKLLSAITLDKKHGYWNRGNSITTNITFDSKAVKYNIHGDTGSPSVFHSIVSDCHFIKRAGVSDNYKFHIGMGASDTQFMSYWNCTREMTGTFVGSAVERMFFWHNRANQQSVTLLELIGNDSSNIDMLITTEQESQHADRIIIKNCFSSKTNAKIVYQKATGSAFNLQVFEIENCPTLTYKETTYP